MIMECVMNKTRGTVGQRPKCRRNLLTTIYLADLRSVPKVSRAGTVVTRRNTRLSQCNYNNLGVEIDHLDEIRHGVHGCTPGHCQRQETACGICVKLTFVEDQPQPKPSRKPPWILGISVLIFLTVLILLQSSNLWKTFSVDTASDTLLLYALSSLNFIAFVIFGFIFLRSIIKLARERRAFQLGARIKTRLLLYFAAISLLPIIAMAGFSYLFMNRALERWFSQIPENVVLGAREVESQALQVQSAKLDATARMIGTIIEKNGSGNIDLKEVAKAGNMTLIELTSANNKVLERFERPLTAEQKAELDLDLAGVRGGGESGVNLSDGKGFDAALFRLADGRRLLIVPGPAEGKGITQLVDSSLNELDRLKAQQIIVRQVGFLTLGVLTFLLIFASSWMAFYIARGITVPIKALAVGADEIAQGNLSHRVEVFAEDELALLVTTFNQMSAKLEENSAEINEGRRYIETVLQSLPTGVISFDSDNKVSTINGAAINILRLEEGDLSNVRLDELVSAENKVILERLISRAKRIGRAAEQTILRRENSDGTAEGVTDIPVALTASALPEGSGAVLVIEDLSELIAAQRASAWQEVARRMAHEIKNPLTPIQLSAERIAKRALSEPPALAGGIVRKLSASAFSEESDPNSRVIREGTATILREVQTLKAMVDEFSQFARLPNVELEAGNINDVIEQAAALYLDRHGELLLETRIDPVVPETKIDAEQLKRVFVNLIDNALEAPAGDDAKSVVVSSRFDGARDLVIVEVSDNGQGIDPADYQKLFQPYFSTKGRGTGLGLAIVQRIVSEHQGKIKAVPNQPRGAKFIIEIPV
jgi:two-component system, NtrC family, nitrogen regulation sensor histidine kinase NtrY